MSVLAAPRHERIGRRAADEGARSYRDPVTPNCPTCGSVGVPVLFGLPVEAAGRAARDGRLALGGCIVPNNEPPNWECQHHHRWRHGLEDDQQALIISILRTYGYDDVVENE